MVGQGRAELHSFIETLLFSGAGTLFLEAGAPPDLSSQRTIMRKIGTGGRKVTRAPGRLVRDGRTQEKSWYTPPMSGTRLLLGSGNPGLSRAWRQPDGRAAAPNLDRDDKTTPCGSTFEIGMHSVVRRPSYPVLPNPTPTHPSAERNSTTFHVILCNTNYH